MVGQGWRGHAPQEVMEGGEGGGGERRKLPKPRVEGKKHMQKARVIPFLTIILLQKAQHSVFCRV